MIGLSELDAARHVFGMSRLEFLSAIGAALGFLGGLILAFAAHAELSAHRLAILALQVQVDALIRSPDDLVQIGGTDRHVKRGECIKAALTYVGIVFLALSFIITVAAFFIPLGQP